MKGEDIKEKQNQAGNPIFVLILFVVLIGFVFYVPDIYKKYNKEINNFFGIKDEEEKEKEKYEGITPQSAYYQLNSKSTFDYNEITISDVTLENKTLSMTVRTAETFDLDKSGYYIEFYQNQKTFVGRRALHGIITKSLTLEIDLSNLNVDGTTYYVISHIDDDAIGGFSTDKDESSLQVLNCQKNNETYTYDFYMKKLTKATYKYSYTDYNLETYGSKLLELQKLEKDYKDMGGISTSISENANTILFLAEFDYSVKNEFEKVRDRKIFAKNTLKHVIKFKMDAEGFDCK